MSSWILKVVGIILSTSCAEMLLPNGKTKSACRIVLSLVCLLVFAEPIANIKNFNFDFTDVLEDDTVVSYIDKTNEYFCALTEKEVVDLLTQSDIKVEECNVVGKIEKGEFKLEKISVKIDKKVISGEDEHIISIEKIKNTITNALTIPENKVEIYGE